MISERLTPPLRVAALELDDVADVQRFLMRLDRDSRRRRFGFEIGEDALRAHAIKALTESVWTFGAFRDGDLRGVIELYACGTERMLEVALVVEPEWRRRGLAWALVQKAMRAGCTVGSLRLVFARDNWPMRALAAKADARFDLALDEMCADIDVSGGRRHS